MATTSYNILQHRERIDMFIIDRKHITPRRMLYRARIVLESCSYRNCNRPISCRALLIIVLVRAQRYFYSAGPQAFHQLHPALATRLQYCLPIIGLLTLKRDSATPEDAYWEYSALCVHYKKLSYRRVTARCVLSVVILPVATQQCRNYLYDKS